MTNLDTSNKILLRPNIYFLEDSNHSEFIQTVRSDLDKIEKLKVGKRLLQKIASSANPIFIKYGESSARCFIEDRTKSITRGLGCKAFVFFDGKGTSYWSSKMKEVSKPSFVDLAHELIHAFHMSVGKFSDSQTCDRFVWSNDEEYHTIVGFPSKNNSRKIPKITENAFLAELGLPERISHSFVKHPICYNRVKLVAKTYDQMLDKMKSNLGVIKPQIPRSIFNDWELGITKHKFVLYRGETKKLGKFITLLKAPWNVDMTGKFQVPIDIQLNPHLQLKNMFPNDEVYKDPTLYITSVDLCRITDVEAEFLANPSKDNEAKLLANPHENQVVNCITKIWQNILKVAASCFV